MKILRVIFIAILIAAPVNSPAASVDEAYQFPAVVSPGQTVEILGAFDPAKPASAKLYPLGSKDPNDGKDPKEIKVKSANLVAITLPDNLPPGRYYLKLTYNGAVEQVPGEMRVEASAVKLDSAFPTTAYRNARGGFDFDINGQNFNKDDPENNKIYISGRVLSIKWLPGKQECDASTEFPCAWAESAEKLHVIGYQAGPYQGPLTFSVKVGAIQSTEKKLTLARMSETGVLIWSIGIFLALAFVIYRLVAAGIRDTDPTLGKQRPSPLLSFFIDKQTNSYSLSKFQFLMFSCVFVFGYLYVFLCRWLVQWVFVLPDVPSAFTGVLAISAGTTIAAAGATSALGSKGAGRAAPTAADLITSGGQVIPERFQFLVWTLVACFGFLALLISQDPALIDGFPTFPPGLLYVMGVSAGGYLGGKLVRPAGPVIRNIALNLDSAEPQITIQGENLSSEADFFVDSKKLPIVTSTEDKAQHDQLVVPTLQEQGDRTFASELKITIHEAAGLDLRTGDHTFRIMNKDGQFADARFTADLPKIDEVLDDGTPLGSPPGTHKEIASVMNLTPITVLGRGFRAGTEARWTPPQDATSTPESSAVEATFVNSNTLKIMLTPGVPGTGTLVLVTPNGFSAVATVTVTPRQT